MTGPADVPPTTGDPAIDAALADLARLGERPLVEHAERLAATHEVLRSALDAEPPGPAPAAT